MNWKQISGAIVIGVVLWFITKELEKRYYQQPG